MLVMVASGNHHQHQLEQYRMINENVCMSDLEFMQRAIAHARSVEGRTSPRPPVGAVVVRDALSLRRVHIKTIDGDLLIEGDSFLETQHGRGYSH
jgi:hypothetical protein